MSQRIRPRKLIVSALIALIGFILVVVIGNIVRAPKQKDTTKTTTTQSQAAGFDKSRYPLDQPNSIWIVVNKNRSFNPLDYAPADLVNVGGGQRIRQEAATALQQMFSAALGEGRQLQALSGYRSYATQKTVYAREVATNGQAIADTQSAKPGYSEHQTGLAIDVGGGGCGIQDCFGNTAEGKWVAAHAHEYGYIVRYVSGKESITGYRPEPWHIRYVGRELAAEMKKQNIQTLEEFFGL